VAILHISLGIMGILVACLVLAMLVGTGMFAFAVEQEPVPMVVLSVIGLMVGGFTILLSVPGIVGGVALLRYKPWARILVFILSAIGLLNIPVGTGVGIYSFWVLTRDEAAELFS
jgi:hypothetical protein